MGIGPAPALSGYVAIPADSPGASALDSNGDQSGVCSSNPSSGGPGGGGPSSCGADGGAASGGDNSGGDGGYVNVDFVTRSGFFGPGGDYFGQVAPGQIVTLSLGAADSPCAPPSSLGCVAPSSRIALYPDGCKFAGEIQVGDVLLSRNAEGENSGEAVNGLQTSSQSCVLVETESGRRFTCSTSHELMVFGANVAEPAVRRASELTLSDSLSLQDGTRDAITCLSTVGRAEVVRISVTGPNHVYLSDGFWSHNKIGTAWPANASP